jgi:uncharacterized linocin/CFP29 family protein
MGRLKGDEIKRRQKAVVAALGSVRAEGLNPSESVILRAERYVAGKISADQLRRETLEEVQARSKQNKG